MDINENLEQEPTVLSLTDENGETTDFEFLDVLEYEGSEYIVLLPLEGENEEYDELVIMLIEPVDEETENYLAVEDEATAIAVFELFKEKYKDEFNFID